MRPRTSLAGRVALAVALVGVAAAVGAALATRWLGSAWLGAGLTVLILAPFIVWLSARVTEPWMRVLNAVRDGIVSLRDHDFSISVSPPAARELHELVTAYNSLGELLRRGPAPRVAVASYLLAPGFFQRRLESCGADLVSAPLGSDRDLATLIWERHDEALAEAWRAGVVLAGQSAGALCWHVGGNTDSFGPRLRPWKDGMGLLPYSCGVHYNSEPQRRPLLHRSIAEGELPDGYAADEGVALHYVGTELVQAVSVDPKGAAYRVERDGSGGVKELRLEPRLLSR